MLKSLFPWKHGKGKHNKTKVMAEQTMEDDTAVQQESLLPCHVCGRTFVPRSLEKHGPVCEKNATKKRKIFDSLKQRVEGTDLALFHQKSYLKKQVDPTTAEVAPCVKQSKWKEKHIELVNAIRAAKGETTTMTPPQKRITATTSSSSSHGRCPSCDRQFGPKAFDRHVEWCKEHKARIQKSPANVLAAKERLEARTKYRVPPLRQSQRSLNRDKYSPTIQRQDSICSVKSSSSTSLQRAPSLRKPRSVISMTKNIEVPERKREKSLPKIEKFSGDYRIHNKEPVVDNNIHKEHRETHRETPNIKASPKIETPKGFHTKRVIPPKKINNTAVNNSLEDIKVCCLSVDNTPGRKMVTWKDTVGASAVKKSIASKEKHGIKIVSSEILPNQIISNDFIHSKKTAKVKSSPCKISNKYENKFIQKTTQKIYCNENFSVDAESSECLSPEFPAVENIELDSDIDINSDLEEESVPFKTNRNYKLEFLPTPNEFTSSETQTFLDGILNPKKKQIVQTENKLLNLDANIDEFCDTNNTTSKTTKRKRDTKIIKKCENPNEDNDILLVRQDKKNIESESPKRILSTSRKKQVPQSDKVSNKNNDENVKQKLIANLPSLNNNYETENINESEKASEICDDDDNNLTITQKYLKNLENKSKIYHRRISADHILHKKHNLLERLNFDTNKNGEDLNSKQNTANGNLENKTYENDYTEIDKIPILETLVKEETTATTADLEPEMGTKNCTKLNEEICINKSLNTSKTISKSTHTKCTNTNTVNSDKVSLKIFVNSPTIDADANQISHSTKLQVNNEMKEVCEANLKQNVSVNEEKLRCGRKNKNLILKESIPIINGRVHEEDLLDNDSDKNEHKGSHDSGIYSEETNTKCSNNLNSKLSDSDTTIGTCADLNLKESCASLALNLQGLTLSDDNSSEKLCSATVDKDELSLSSADSEISCTILEQNTGDKLYYFSEKSPNKKLPNITIQTSEYSIILNNNINNISDKITKNKIKCKIRGNEIKVYNAGKGQIKLLLHDNNEPPSIIKEQNTKSSEVSDINYDDSSSLNMVESTSLESLKSKFDKMETILNEFDSKNCDALIDNSPSLGSLTRKFEQLDINSNNKKNIPVSEQFAEEFSNFSMTNNNNIIKKCTSESLIRCHKIRMRECMIKKVWSQSNMVDYINSERAKQFSLKNNKTALDKSKVIDIIAENLRTCKKQSILDNYTQIGDTEKFELLRQKLQQIQSSNESILDKELTTIQESSTKEEENFDPSFTENLLTIANCTNNEVDANSDSKKSSASCRRNSSEKSLISIYTNVTKFDTESTDGRLHYIFSSTSLRNCHSDDCLSKTTGLKAPKSQDITRLSSSASISKDFTTSNQICSNDRHKILELAAQEFINDYYSCKYQSGEIEYFVPKKRRKLATKSTSSENNTDESDEPSKNIIAPKQNESLKLEEHTKLVVTQDNSQLNSIKTEDSTVFNSKIENFNSICKNSCKNNSALNIKRTKSELTTRETSASSGTTTYRSDLGNFSPRVLTILETLMVANTKLSSQEQKTLAKSKPFQVPLELCEKLIDIDSKKLPKIFNKIEERNKYVVDAFEEPVKLPKIKTKVENFNAIVLKDVNGILKYPLLEAKKIQIEDKIVQCPSFTGIVEKTKPKKSSREGSLNKQDKGEHSKKSTVYLEYQPVEKRSHSKNNTTATYDPFESAQRQFMELLESDDFNNFDLTKMPVQHTPRPHTSDTTLVSKPQQQSPKSTTKKTIKSAELLPRSIDFSNNIKRTSVIDPPTTFQDNLDLLNDDFEYIENLINSQFNDENKNNGDSDSFFLHVKGTDSFNLNNILNLNERKYSDDMSSIDPRLINENDNLSIPDHFKLEDYSPTTTDTDVTIQNESINYYNEQLDNKVTENNQIDQYSAQFDKKISDENDHYVNKSDKKTPILEPLVLPKTEGKRELKRSVSSVSKSSKCSEENYVVNNKQTANKGNKTKGKVLKRSDSSVGKSKAEKKTLSSLKKSMSYEPSPKPSLKNREDVKNYFDEQIIKSPAKNDRKTPEKEVDTPFENSLATPIKPEDLFAVDDEMYEEYKKYEELYLKEKEHAKNTKKHKQKTIDPNYGLLTASEEDDHLAKSNKISNDSAYGSLNRKTPKHRIRSAKLSPLEQKHPIDSTSSSGSEHCPSSPAAVTSTNAKMSKFCHECGNKYPVNTAKFCVECGIRRLVL